jgi:hypothetical protein
MDKNKRDAIGRRWLAWSRAHPRGHAVLPWVMVLIFSFGAITSMVLLAVSLSPLIRESSVRDFIDFSGCVLVAVICMMGPYTAILIWLELAATRVASDAMVAKLTPADQAIYQAFLKEFP